MGNFKFFGILIFFKNGKDLLVVILVYGLGVSDWDEMVGVNKFFWDFVYGLVECGIVVICYDKCIKVYGVDSVFVGKEIIFDEELVDDVFLVIKFVCFILIINFEWIYIFGYSLGGILVFCIV